MTKTEYKLQVWANTLEAVREYPDQFSRTEAIMVQNKYEDNLHAVMHRAGEQQDWEF